MADNVTVVPGQAAGPAAQVTYAADEIAGVKFQRVKIALGADGAFDNDVDAGQQAKALSIPVAIATEQDASKVDDAAFTPATDRVIVIGASADETAPDDVDEGDAGALRMTLKRGLHVNRRTAAGVEILPMSRKSLTASYLRENNTTAYSVGDALSNSATTPSALTFAGAARVNGGQGKIVSVTVFDSIVPTTPGALKLWLFVGTPVIPDSGAAFDDNVAFNIPDTEFNAANNRCIGVVSLAGGVSTGSGYFWQAQGLAIPFVCNPANKDIWGLVSVESAYQSSANGNTLKFNVEVEQDD